MYLSFLFCAEKMTWNNEKYSVWFSLCEMLMLSSIWESGIMLNGNLEPLGAGIGRRIGICRKELDLIVVRKWTIWIKPSRHSLLLLNCSTAPKGVRHLATTARQWEADALRALGHFCIERDVCVQVRDPHSCWGSILGIWQQPGLMWETQQFVIWVGLAQILQW